MSVQLECANGHRTFYMMNVTTLEQLQGEERECDECGKPITKLIPWEEVTDPEALLNEVENDLENGNYHSMTSLPSTLYERIAPLVTDKLVLAHILSNISLYTS